MERCRYGERGYCRRVLQCRPVVERGFRMFTVNMPLHIMLADAKGASELYPGTVTKVAEVIEAEFNIVATIPHPEAGAEAMIFFEIRGKFFQQKTTVGGFIAAPRGGPVTGTFYPVGAPVSAEK